MAATATCSARAKLAEGADPRKVTGSRFYAQKTTSGGLCVPPTPPPTLSLTPAVQSPHRLSWMELSYYLADPGGAASCLGPTGPAD